jgi:hypothetical protein
MDPSTLQGSRQRTYQILLEKKGGELARQYLSAIAVLECDGIDDCYCMVAHQLRELINNLWTIADDLPTDPTEKNVKDAAAALQGVIPAWKAAWGITDWGKTADWMRAAESSECHDVLNQVNQIIAALDRPHIDRARLRRAIPALDPSHVKAPEAVYAELEDAMWAVRRYFVGHAHRSGRPPDEHEFAEQIARLDALIEALFPALSVEAFRTLDANIAEVERG